MCRVGRYTLHTHFQIPKESSVSDKSRYRRAWHEKFAIFRQQVAVSRQRYKICNVNAKLEVVVNYTLAADLLRKILLRYVAVAVFTDRGFESWLGTVA